MGFTVIDTRGNLKTISGSGALVLPDPLTVPYGGLGLSTWPRGGILYSPFDNAWALRIPDPDFDRDVPKVLSNILYPGEIASPSDPTLGLLPRWVGKSYFAQQGGGLGKPGMYDNRGVTVRFGEAVDGNPGYLGTGWISGLSGTGGNIIDDISTWFRITTSAGTSNYSFVTMTMPAAALSYHSFFMEAKFRTSAVATDLRFLFGLFNQTPNAGTDALTMTGLGIAHSTPRSDGGFVSWRGDGSASSYGSTVILPYAASTIYTMSINYPDPRSGFASLKISNSVTSGQQIVTLGSEAFNTTRLYAYLAIQNTSGVGSQTMDLGATFFLTQSQTIF